jgi:hypothetical protein
MVDPAGGTAYPTDLTSVSAMTSSFTIYPNVPEPATLSLLGTAALAVTWWRRRSGALVPAADRREPRLTAASTGSRNPGP